MIIAVKRVITAIDIFCFIPNLRKVDYIKK
jgi:hypothetical protein